MATVLENYYSIRTQVDTRIAQGGAPADAVWWYGEVVYRIGVLETFQMFCQTAPLTTEAKVLQGHYQMLDAYIQSIALERRYGPNRGPDTQKEREAAQTNLGRVIQDTASGSPASPLPPLNPTVLRSAGWSTPCCPPGSSFGTHLFPSKKRKRRLPRHEC